MVYFSIEKYFFLLAQSFNLVARVSLLECEIKRDPGDKVGHHYAVARSTSVSIVLWNYDF